MEQEGSEKIGFKPGSQNSCTARRGKGNKIQTDCKKTCVRYPKTILQKTGKGRIVGDEAEGHKDSKYPLNLGLIESQEGIQQMKHILEAFNIPMGSDMVIASPAMEITEGKQWLTKAVDEVCTPNRIWMVSEALCSAVTILKDANKIKDTTHMVANLGSSTFELGCFQGTNIVHLSAHSEAGGNIVDSKIMNKIQGAIGDAMITLKDARDYKEKASLTEPKTFIVKGQTRDGITEGAVKDEITTPLKEYVVAVCEVIKKELKIINPQIRKAALENPIIISGGMSNIEGLPELITSTLSETLHYNINTDYLKDGSAHIAPAIGALMLAEAIAEEEANGGE